MGEVFSSALFFMNWKHSDDNLIQYGSPDGALYLPEFYGRFVCLGD